MDVEIVKVDKGLPIPEYAHDGDAGLDLYSADEGTIHPGEIKIFSSGQMLYTVI